MVKSNVSTNGPLPTLADPEPAPDSQLSAGPRPGLPEFIVLGLADMQSFPSPGTQRVLKAQTGKDYMQMVGPNADTADRTQTQIWQHLRKTIKDLRWDECEDIGLQISDDAAASVNPSLLANAVPSLDSVDSGE